MNQEQYFKRVVPLLRPESLRSKRIAVVGNGSVGSRVATELGRLGVGLLLIDKPGERLEEHNIHRHELGYRSLGQLKTTALADHIRNYNPNVEIATAECDVTLEPDRFEQLLVAHRVDLILVCTDNQPSRHAINAVATKLGLPTISSGVYDGGVGGEVYRTGPGAACYACMAGLLNHRQTTRDQPATIDYSNPDLDGLQSTSALNMDIGQISLIQTRVALQELLGGETDLTGLPREVNLIIFANRTHPKAFPRPLHANFHVMPRHPDCLICGQQRADTEAEAKTILAGLGVGSGQ